MRKTCDEEADHEDALLLFLYIPPNKPGSERGYTSFTLKMYYFTTSSLILTRYRAESHLPFLPPDIRGMPIVALPRYRMILHNIPLYAPPAPPTPLVTTPSKVATSSRPANKQYGEHFLPLHR